MSSKYQRRLGEHEKALITVRLEEGKQPNDIAKEVGVSSTAIRHFIRKNDLIVKLLPVRDRTRPCIICGEVFTPKYDDGLKKDKYKTCSQTCTRKHTSNCLTKYTQEDVNNVIKLKEKFTPNRDIEHLTGVNLNKIKEIVKENELFLSEEQMQKNAYSSKLEKDPNCMSKMRSFLTEESFAKTSASLKATYSDPKWSEFFSNNGKKIWVDLKADPKKLADTIERRSKSMRETVLGMTIPEYDKLILQIKHLVENKKETITSASIKIGLDPGTTLREFHRKGWSDLITQFTSAGQLEVFNYVKELVPDRTVLLNDKTGLRGTELDIYVPKFRFGIEYNGLHWHSTSHKDINMNSHRNKSNKAIGYDINLLAIFEDEWADPIKQELIKQMIQQRLEVSKQQSLNVTDLILEKLDINDQVIDFFNKYHLDGYIHSQFAYGLFLKDELVFCASFKEASNSRLELTRMVTDYNYEISGAIVKVLKVINKPVISKSSNRLSDSDIFIDNGFTKLPNNDNSVHYWYTDLGSRIHRVGVVNSKDSDLIAQSSPDRLEAVRFLFGGLLFGSDEIFKISSYGHQTWAYQKY